MLRQLLLLITKHNIRATNLVRSYGNHHRTFLACKFNSGSFGSESFRPPRQLIRHIRNGGLLLSSTILFWHQFGSSDIFKVALCKREIMSGDVKRLRENTDKELELFDAIRHNDTKKVDQIVRLEDFDVNSRHSLGWTPLHLAAIMGKAEIVQKLLDAGADIDAIDEFSNAAQIAYEHRLNFLQVHLIREEEFSDILSANVSFLGTTALHYACLVGSVETIRVLMKNHANPNLENEFGHKPGDYLNQNDSRIVKLLPEFNTYCKEYQEYISQLKMEERRKFPLEQRIREVIVGQEGAITTVSATIRRKENGWIDNEHPLVFLFLGSSGIGKTELAKQVANYLHSSSGSSQKESSKSRKSKSGNKKQQQQSNGNVSKGFIRIDMSEYQERHEVSKFIGSPPGYVGHDDGGQLTRALTECPNAVVLFDEVEKAHPDVLTIMLQLFDEGRLTDGKGRTIECKDAIFIMTSNLASEEIAEYGIRLRRESEELAKAHYSGKFINETETEQLDKVVVSRYFKDKVIRPILKRHFKRDEFLGRINEIVYFLPFSRSELHKLVTRELELWSERAAQRHRIQLSWDRQVIGVLANGYDVHYGARSIKYEVERRVVNKLASAHENRLMLPGAKVHLVVSEDGEEFKFAKLDQHDQKSLSSSVSGDSSADQMSTEENEEMQAKEIETSSTDLVETTGSNKQHSIKTVPTSPANIEQKLKLLIENPNSSSSSDSSPKRTSFLNKII